MEQLDRVVARTEPGYSYARYDNPTNAALEELMTVLERGHGALACASGMAAVEMAVATALADRRKSVVAADALYGATISLLMKVLEPAGVAVRFADVCDLDALRAAVAEAKPGCILVETISNPLLRVPEIDKIAEIARQAGAALVVDNTFGTPLLVRPSSWAPTSPFTASPSTWPATATCWVASWSPTSGTSSPCAPSPASSVRCWGRLKAT